MVSVELHQLLIASGKSIAVAESLTGGTLQAAIAAMSGASHYFSGGITAYNLDAKVRLLDVDRGHAESVNSVSSRVAEQMAAGVRKRFDSQIGIGTTGYAEPYEDEGVVAPFAYFAVDLEGRVVSDRVDAGDRSRVEVQHYVTQVVLRQLVAMLQA